MKAACEAVVGLLESPIMVCARAFCYLNLLNEKDPMYHSLPIHVSSEVVFSLLDYERPSGQAVSVWIFAARRIGALVGPVDPTLTQSIHLPGSEWGRRLKKKAS